MKELMYVRCPADVDSITDPRTFVCGQIQKIDDFKKTAWVKIHDPFRYKMFFEDLPIDVVELPIEVIDHCSLFIGTNVYVKSDLCKAISYHKKKDGYYYYYLQRLSDKEVIQVCEKDITASFNNGRIDPADQLKRYEFQNPCWYLGRTIVSKSMNILENSIYGFKELAGCKIYLLPHQINTIMRCLQDDPCRYMLADEVGMGKTIEALSIFKIYIQTRCNIKAIIIVPETLKEQWKTEMLLKFNIPQGATKDNNTVEVRCMTEIQSNELESSWDFVIIDEVHRYLSDADAYGKLHNISKRARNILSLSATPVQQRHEEYLKLLRLLLPQKYDNFTIDQFEDLIDKQSRIIQKTALILDDLDDYEEEIFNSLNDNMNPHESEECEELFEEIYDELNDICDSLNDTRLGKLLGKIKFEDDDLGVYAMKVITSYICSNYQVESNIIRNRRKLLESDDKEENLLPTRELQTISYDLDEDRNLYESLTYRSLSDWIDKITAENNEIIDIAVKPLLSTFFSSPWAFLSALNQVEVSGIKIDKEIKDNTRKWISFENNIIEYISDIVEDPGAHQDSYSTRIVTVLDYILEDLYDQKIVLFTTYQETFHVYKEVLQKVFDPNEISFFGAEMDATDIEINAYRFQNEDNCRIMLCDYTGGEGRNFQCADYIVHIDLPWEANVIEQRIGRLDRLERDRSRSIVYSVVVYARDTFEEALFKFWNEGLNIFTQSLSGMEIIMGDINNEIMSAIKSDFKFGLFDRIPHIIELAKEMRTTVRIEQNFDAAGLIYRPMYNELKRLINFYAENENELFARTMTNWASLAGFRGSSNQEGIISYADYSFSPGAAINSRFIPPRWDEYLRSEQNIFVNRVQEEYNRTRSLRNQDRSIRGTFVRKQAIENDYIHFFAPGDAVFESIVDNALNSCKGQVSAFAIPSSINWCGLIFTWSMYPNDTYLIKKDVSFYALSPYRNYLMADQVVTPIPITNNDSISNESIVREYEQIVSKGFKPKGIVHLGKRSSSPGFLSELVDKKENINWFKSVYPDERWSEFVTNARESAAKQAFSIFNKKSNIRGAKEEMQRSLSARAANSEYYGLDDDDLESLQSTQEIIIDAMRHPKINLESAAFVWMVKMNYE